ncbi:MAG TPA: glycoside hydrolase domain-containing protein [Thermoanaerobaculia bacterium]|nr:glycoside hydrolase domain-containing protein [Thermoanaerobaculia bacterium]
MSEGIGFVGRYYSRTTHITGKKLTADEAQLICNAGLLLVAVYEDGPTSYSYFSGSRGTADAEGAMQQAEAVGQPSGSAIYFTVDYDAAEDEITGNISAYFSAIAAALRPTYRVGVYGSGSVCSAILEAGSADLAWLAQSTGWSGYSQFTGWAIKQGPEQSVCGLNSDTDDAHGEFGAFTIA